MTNSIASSKCLPPVLTSGNYGMSQNRYIDESKEYIFVKLTDSAYRAVEEYQRNEHAKRFGSGQCAKIQLVGNSGVIHFPTPDDAEGRKFGFAIDDVEGSLECIQQTQNELDVLGSLSLRMRIHANDDVYDTTRTKMAIAEETEKSKCIREIKPNQTDIGRKVKKAAMTSTVGTGNSYGNNSNNNGYQRDLSNSNHATSSNSNFLSNSNNNNRSKPSNNSSPSNGAVAASNSNSNSYSSKHMTSSRSPNPTLLGGSTTTGSSSSSSNRYNSPHNSNSYNNQTSSILPSLTTASSLSSALTAGLHQTTHSSSCSNGYSSGFPPESNNKAARLSLGGGARAGVRPSLGGGSGFQGSSKSSAAGGNGKLPDISKRKLRERLIHLLALKPFKKPELYARLANEGMRDKDRLSISTTLKDIATLSRDNTYNLKRPMWNDVNENWPFYTEQEVQQLKRRKPQNLTPPLSSDAGSSTSGQSPTSTHTGSPPPLVGNGLKRGSLERDTYEDSISCGVQAKKQRISHFKKDAAALMATGAGSGTGAGGNPRLNYGNSSSSGHIISRNSANSYSPLGNHLEQENNSDLSYNVLDNVDDFMSHVEQQGNASLSGKGNNTNSASSRRNPTLNNNKEKRFANSFTKQQQERSSNKELMMKKKPSVSPTAYAGTFVPEKSSSSRGSSANSSYQRQSPSNSYAQQQQQYKTGNSVIFSPKTQSQVSPRDDVCYGNNNIGSSNRYNHQQQKTGKTASRQPRSPTPPMAQQQHQQQQHQQQQQQHYQQQPHHTSSNHQYETQRPQTQQQQQQQHQSPQQEPQQSSPTQQIAAAVSSYATATSSQSSEKHYDFSNYTPITSIEQRRHYKTEFESDYDEYRKLLAQIEGVSMRFRSLAERLENASKGCPDYYDIKQQIVSEYQRIRNEEALQREKQRFDYLHEKLAHIKQLVTDYDKTLTSATAAHQLQLQQQQQQHFQQQQQQQLSAIDSDSCAAQAMMDTTQSNKALNRNSRLSPMVGDNSPHYQQQQHHAAETIHQSQPPLHLQHVPQYNGHDAPAQAPPLDSDTEDSSDSSNDDGDDDDHDDEDSNDDDDSNDDAGSHDNQNDVDDDDGDNESY